jgi:hypothetical protein
MNSRPILAIFALLASLAPCSAPAACPPGTPSPYEQTIFPFSVIRPNGGVIITGVNFGTTPGTILIHLTDYRGNQLDYPLDHLQWGDTFAAGTIQNIQFVIGQQVTFEVKNACGDSSRTAGPPLTAIFTPNSDVAVLPWQDLPCVMTSNNNGDSCQNRGGHSFPFECSWGLPVLGQAVTNSFSGEHMSGWGGGNGGTDTFSTKLIKGWSVESSTFGWVNANDQSGASGGGNSASMSFSAAATTWTVVWRENSCWSLGYDGVVTVTGPRGVPYH